MSTSTLTSLIDDLVGVFTDYIGVLVAEYWPLLVGLAILGGVIGLVVRFFFRKG